jgi:hypothetical protein
MKNCDCCVFQKVCEENNITPEDVRCVYVRKREKDKEDKVNVR